MPYSPYRPNSIITPDACSARYSGVITVSSSTPPSLSCISRTYTLPKKLMNMCRKTE